MNTSKLYTRLKKLESQMPSNIPTCKMVVVPEDADIDDFIAESKRNEPDVYFYFIVYE